LIFINTKIKSDTGGPILPKVFWQKKFGNMGHRFCTGGLYITGIILAKNGDFA
jgi:hypothetical protein